MPMRIRAQNHGPRPHIVSGDLLKLLGAFLTIHATLGISILGRCLLHLDTVTDPAAAQAMLDQGQGLAMALVLLCRVGGGVAWVVFARTAVTGFQYTSNTAKYLIRVAVTAVLSEIPYDLCTYGTWFSFQSQNVLFSLLVGLTVLALVEEVARSTFARIALMTGGVLWTVLLNLQYGTVMVLSMYLFYFLEERELVRDLLILAVSALEILSVGPQVGLISGVLPAALTLVLLHWYHDDEPRIPKWIFYGLYPLHLVIIAILCVTMF